MTRRLKPEMRRLEILAAATTVALKTDYRLMTREQIAEQAGITGPTVHHYFGSIAGLKKAVMRAAIRDGTLEIIAQGLLGKDPQAMALSSKVRRLALEHSLGKDP